jgi:hypothetical protein
MQHSFFLRDARGASPRPPGSPLPTRGGGPVDTGAAGPVARWGDQTEVLFGRVVHRAAAIPQSPRGPAPEQPVSSKFELLSVCALAPEQEWHSECVVKYPNAGAGVVVVHEEGGTKSAVLMDGRDRSPCQTSAATQHTARTRQRLRRSLCGLPRSGTGSWLRDALAPGLG